MEKLKQFPPSEKELQKQMKAIGGTWEPRTKLLPARAWHSQPGFQVSRALINALIGRSPFALTLSAD